MRQRGEERVFEGVESVEGEGRSPPDRGLGFRAQDLVFRTDGHLIIMRLGFRV